jgi:hypothetical protein
MAAKSISIPVTGNTAPLRKSLTTAEKQIKRFADQSKQDMKRAATAFAVAAGGAAVLATRMNAAFEEMSTANARIVQISKQMGLFDGQVNATSERLIKLARATALNTGVDANAIKATQAKLLTFAELAKTATTVGGSFDRATQAAVDLAAAGFGEVAQNAVQLGKALQDPIKGITALARSGVTFTDQQKEQIRTLVESNQVLQAQELILAAIEQQVGGTAVATANASDRMREGMRVVKEEIGRGLAPAFEQLAVVAVQFGTWAEKNGPIIAALTIGLGSMAVAVLGVKAAMATATAVSAAYALAQTGLAAANIAVQVSTVVGIASAVIATATIATLTKKVYDNAKANRDNAAAMGEAADAQARLRAIQLDKQGVIPPRLEELPEIYTSVGNAAETAREKERRKFQAVKDSLKSAKDALRQYVAAISDAITKEVSLSQAFSNAATAQTDAQDAVNNALRERSDAYEALNQAKATRDQNAYDEALRRVAAAEAAVTKAQDVKPKDYTAIFAEQIAAAKAFAGYVKQLVQNGLGKAGLAQILDLGPVAGAQVAKDLLGGTGGLTIAGLNADLAAVAAEGTAAGMAIPGVSEVLGAQARRGSGGTYYIQVTAGIGDKNEIGRQVVEVLQQYEKRVGALPIKVKK